MTYEGPSRTGAFTVGAGVSHRRSVHSITYSGGSRALGLVGWGLRVQDTTSPTGRSHATVRIRASGVKGPLVGGV